MRALIAAALLAGAPAQAEPPVAVVHDVFRPGPARSELRTVDPVTLRSAGPPVRLRGYLRGWTRSPDGRQLALGVGDGGRVQIVDTAQRTGATITGPVPLPTEKNVYCVIRSPFKDKDSREHFEVRTHKRLIDIHNPTPKTVDSLMRLDLPAGVDIEIKL